MNREDNNVEEGIKKDKYEINQTELQVKNFISQIDFMQIKGQQLFIDVNIFLNSIRNIAE